MLMCIFLDPAEFGLIIFCLGFFTYRILVRWSCDFTTLFHCSCFWVSGLRRWARWGRGRESSHPLSAGSRSLEKALGSVYRADCGAPGGSSRFRSAAVKEPEPLGSAAQCRLGGPVGRVQSARWALAAGPRAPLSPVTCLQGVGLAGQGMGVPSETSCPPQAGATLVPRGSAANERRRSNQDVCLCRLREVPFPAGSLYAQVTRLGRRALDWESNLKFLGKKILWSHSVPLCHKLATVSSTWEICTIWGKSC